MNRSCSREAVAERYSPLEAAPPERAAQAAAEHAAAALAMAAVRQDWSEPGADAASIVALALFCSRLTPTQHR
jgi:hypothetical protein